jgi:hypothetical protein
MGVTVSQESNGAGQAGPLVIFAFIGSESPAGSAYVELDYAFTSLSVGSTPADCAVAEYVATERTAFSSATALGMITEARPTGSTVLLESTGRPFDCGSWGPPGTAALTAPLLFYDLPGPTDAVFQLVLSESVS